QTDLVQGTGTTTAESRVCRLLVVLAALVGLGLMIDTLSRGSATFDEVLYLNVAAKWWRTGVQEAITRAGTPLTFWKLQQTPMLWSLDRLGYGSWIDDPLSHEATLLPLARASALWIWLAALSLTAYWSRLLYGPRAMAVAAWWFALSPNLLAHGTLVTMELPIVAAMTATSFLFWVFLRTGDHRAFFASAAFAGLAWSCKYSAVLIPPIFAILWCLRRWRDGERGLVRTATRVAGGLVMFMAVMAISDIVLTGGAMLAPSERTGSHPSIDGKYGPMVGGLLTRLYETPIPQDFAGFTHQFHLQTSGMTSYLFGERRENGWRYYYLVATAVKVPLLFFLVLVGRAVLDRRIKSPSSGRDWMLPVTILVFLAIASIGSVRNLGFRYLLPVAPLAIIWISGLAKGGRWSRRLVGIGLVGQALAIASIHPYELSYFNALAGGPRGGRHILADSNLDWGQGLKPLVRLQKEQPEFRDMTLYYFGASDPTRYGFAGRYYRFRALEEVKDLPSILSPQTTYLAVSASLQWGPYGPEGYFRNLDRLKPVRLTDDTTIAIYRTSDLKAALNSRRLEGQTVMRR
ncbi:MAG TPA: 4-amino-4-deoxy-L-arabinose transferase, partial [Isosphaeraceae bacterium]|nr:4-amino-4-deoxy-L-arabinose transferase [Isosphaeraceae bacterium]